MSGGDDSRTVLCAKIHVLHPGYAVDKTFSYKVPDELRDEARPGILVRIPFGRRRRRYLGYIRELHEVSTPYRENGRTVRLRSIYAIVNTHQVMTGQYRDLLDWAVRHHISTFSDVAAVAIPPRIKRVDDEITQEFSTTTTRPVEDNPFSPDHLPELLGDESYESWKQYRGGEDLISACAQGVIHTALTWTLSEDIRARICDIITITRHRQGAVLLLAPTIHAARQITRELEHLFPDSRIALVSSQEGTAARYRAWLRAFYGAVDILVGTVSSCFVPLPHLRTIIVIDDASTYYASQQAPYHHAAHIAFHRAQTEGCSLFLTGHLHALRTHQWVEEGHLQLVEPSEDCREKTQKSVTVVDPYDKNGYYQRIPSPCYQALHSSLEAQLPVLVQVPRRGNITLLRCHSCGEIARCRHCGGRLSYADLDSDSFTEEHPVCRDCGAIDDHFRCLYCGDHQLRHGGKGDRRTVDELKRALPGVPHYLSHAGQRVDSVPQGPALVVCTPGCEPYAQSGYGAILIVDSEAFPLTYWTLAGEEVHARLWWTLLSLVSSHPEAQGVFIATEEETPLIKALRHGNSTHWAEEMLKERRAANLPPIGHFVAIDGDISELSPYLERLYDALPDTAELIGPMEVPGESPLPSVSQKVVTEPARWLVKYQDDPDGDIHTTIRHTLHPSTAPIPPEAEEHPDDPSYVRLQVDPLHIV